MIGWIVFILFCLIVMAGLWIYKIWPDIELPGWDDNE